MLTFKGVNLQIFLLMALINQVSRAWDFYYVERWSLVTCPHTFNITLP